MKKLTANVAKSISRRSKSCEVKTFQDAIDTIVQFSKLEMRNCFLDGEHGDLVTVAQELKERGFKAYMEHTALKGYYLSVEW